MKTPKLLSKLSAVLTPRPKKRLQATAARAARRPMEDYDEEEPTTNLSSAFVVVLILHVVAVGGIYAFNSIKASRKSHDTTVAQVEQAAPAPPKTAPQKTAPTKAVAHNDAPAAAPKTVHQAAPAAPAAPTVPAPAVIPGKPATVHQYQVKAGDNLTKIAFAYSVTPAELMEANHLKEGAVLRPGQALTIPAVKAGAKTTEAHKTESTPKQGDVPSTATTPGFYTVKKGDTPTSIARNFGLTVEELLKANKITDPKKLQQGQTLKLPPRKS
jgi:LysM repeat protein